MLKSMTPSSGTSWSHAEAEHNDAAPNSWAHVAATVQAYWAARAKRRLHRRAMQDLEHLDDRMLRDIGVTRGEIGRVVRYGRGS